jgi:hypothetical protein
LNSIYPLLGFLVIFIMKSLAAFLHQVLSLFSPPHLWPLAPQFRLRLLALLAPKLRSPHPSTGPGQWPLHSPPPAHFLLLLSLFCLPLWPTWTCPRVSPTAETTPKRRQPALLVGTFSPVQLSPPFFQQLTPAHCFLHLSSSSPVFE